MKTARLVLPLLLLVSACITQPDEKSGGDGERHQAKPLAAGKWESDAIAYGEGDRTDWKVVDLQDTGFLTLEAVLDNADANVTLALFDRYGKPINRVAHRKGDNVQMKLTAEVGIGKYFVMIQAIGESDKTGYAIRSLVR